MRRTELPLILLLAALTAFAGLWTVKGPMTDAPYFGICDAFPSDELEYILPAANLALHGQYPVYGLIGPMADYRLCPQPDTVPYFQTLRQAPPIVFPSKPPIYGLLLGMTYRIWGLLPSSAHLLNLLCWVLMAALLPLAGHLLHGRRGMYIGLVAVPLFLLLCNTLQQKTPETLTKALVMLAAVAGMAAFADRKVWKHVILGLCMALLLLTKGYFALAFGAMLLLYAVFFFRNREMAAVRNGLGFALGAALLLVPWAVHINTAIRGNIKERTEFSQVLREGSPKLMLDNREAIYDDQGDLRPDVVMELLLFHQYQHALENGTVVITNQLGDYNILNVHNEYCTDGDFHPEWRIIRSSFYNQHPELGKHAKLWKFYRYDPLFGLRITWAKLRTGIGGRPWLLVPAVLALLLLLWRRQMPAMLWPTALMVLSMVPVLGVFYGDERFVATVDGAAALVMLAVILLWQRPQSAS